MYELVSNLILLACVFAGIVLGVHKFRQSERPAWARWMLLLPTIAAYAFGLGLLHNWTARPLLAHLQSSHDESRVDRLMGASTLLVALRDVEPDEYARLRAQVAILAGQAPNPDLSAYVQNLNDLSQRLIAKYGPHADDAAVVGFVGASVTLRRRLEEVDPHLCVSDILGKVSNESAQSLKDMPHERSLAAESQGLNESLAAVIRSGAGRPERAVADPAEIDQWFTHLLENNPQLHAGFEAFERALTNSGRLSDEQAKAACAAWTSALERLIAQEPPLAARLLRTMLRQGTGNAAIGGS